MKADDRKAIATIAGVFGVVVAMALLVEIIGGLVAMAGFGWICWKAISSAAQRPRRRKAAAEDRLRKQQESENRLLDEFCLPDNEESRQLIRDWQEYLRKTKAQAAALDALACAGLEVNTGRPKNHLKPMQREHVMGSDQKSLLSRSFDWAGAFLWLYVSAFLGMLALGFPMGAAAAWPAYFCLACLLMSLVQSTASKISRLLEERRGEESLLKLHGLPASQSNRLTARRWIENRREVIATEKVARESALKALEDAGVANPKTRFFDELERRFDHSMPEKLEPEKANALSEHLEFLRWMQSRSAGDV